MSDQTMSDPSGTDAAGACGEPDCLGTLQELDAFLDNEMSPELRASIRHHLDDCPDCDHVFDFHLELKSVVQKKCLEEEMPPGLLTRIEQCFQTDLDGDGAIG